MTRNTPLTAPDEVAQRLAAQDYVADDEIVIAVYLAAALNKPLLVEGPAGVGKTEIAKVLATALDTELIRLQCYEGLDAAQSLYEWNYPRQLLEIRLQESGDGGADDKVARIFSEDFLLERPLLKAIRASRPPVLLIDELDRADEAFESFLLEILSDWQVSIPELGTLRAKQPPHVVITGNRTRPLAEATRRRCLYLWIDYPGPAKEREIVTRKLPGIDAELAAAICGYLAWVREQRLGKTPGVSETLDWAQALVALGETALDGANAPATLGALFKDPQDLAQMRERLRGYRERQPQRHRVTEG
jgi:MoxR-like ATPase